MKPFIHRAAALLCLAVATAVCLSSVTAMSCQRKCGDIEVPFPFGIDGDQPGCAKPGFELSCGNNTESGVPILLRKVQPLSRSVEVLGISLPKGQLRMRMLTATT